MLTDIAVRSAKPQEKLYRKFDGQGLYLEINPKGGKYWRLKYRFAGKERRMALGVYPQVTLAEAREKRDIARKQISQGIDPSLSKKMEKIQRGLNAESTFEAIARDWHQHKSSEWTAKYANTIINRLEADIFPSIGAVPIGDITAPILLKMLRDIEARGVYETTRRALQYSSQIFRHAVIHGKADRDITVDVRGALKTRKTKHHAAIDSRELPAFLSALRANDARMYKPTKLAVELLMLTFVRTGELINMEWEEIDWESHEWIIPKEKMKMGKAHIVPLSRQSLAILEEMKTYNGNRQYVFASHVKPKQPMSNNTILKAIERMGYKGRMTGHGFRALALTTLQEKLNYPFEVADCQLAHAKKHSLGEAYDRAQFLDRRKKMMQHWADYLDGIATTDNVIFGKFGEASG